MDIDPSLGVVRENWNDLVAEAEAIGAARQAEGWRTVVVRPGEVTARSKDTDVFGLNVVVQTSTFAAIRDLVEEGVTFDDAEVYTTYDQGVVFLVLSILDRDTTSAVVIPAWYDLQRGMDMLAVAYEVGEMRTTIRPLDPTEEITFSHADPQLFAPPKRDDDGDE